MEAALVAEPVADRLNHQVKMGLVDSRKFDRNLRNLSLACSRSIVSLHGHHRSSRRIPIQAVRCTRWSTCSQVLLVPVCWAVALPVCQAEEARALQVVVAAAT